MVENCVDASAFLPSYFPPSNLFCYFCGCGKAELFSTDSTRPSLCFAFLSSTYLAGNLTECLWHWHPSDSDLSESGSQVNSVTQLQSVTPFTLSSFLLRAINTFSDPLIERGDLSFRATKGRNSFSFRSEIDLTRWFSCFPRTKLGRLALRLRDFREMLVIVEGAHHFGGHSRHYFSSNPTLFRLSLYLKLQI